MVVCAHRLVQANTSQTLICEGGESADPVRAATRPTAMPVALISWMFPFNAFWAYRHNTQPPFFRSRAVDRQERSRRIPGQLPAIPAAPKLILRQHPPRFPGHRVHKKQALLVHTFLHAHHSQGDQITAVGEPGHIGYIVPSQLRFRARRQRAALSRLHIKNREPRAQKTRIKSIRCDERHIPPVWAPLCQ